MSLINKQIITCPNCGNPIEVTVWDSVNTKTNPEKKKDLINGNLFKAICKHCKKPQNIVYPILYHDQQQNLMIYYAVTDEDFKFALSEFNHYGQIYSKDYTFRIVRSQEALREKAMIFDNGLDDRIVEYLKYTYAVLAKGQIPNYEITQSYLIKQDKKFYIQLSLEIQKFAEFDINHYNTISRVMADSVNDIEICNYLVDLKWVKNNEKAFIKRIEQNTSQNQLEEESEKPLVCKKCGEELLNNSAFCHKCGEKINKKNIKFCRKCGNKLVKNSNFCNNCGTKIQFS